MFLFSVNQIIQHRRGGIYKIIGTPDEYRIEETNEPAYAYQSVDEPKAIKWVRSQSKMEDGRFTLLPNDAKKTNTIHIIADGACRGNPGIGGWGVLIKSNDNKDELFGGEKLTTNNRMELVAVIQGLTFIQDKDAPIHIKVGSKYVMDGATKWIKNWKKNKWKTASKKPVKNMDLWQQLDALISSYENIEWEWVQGHSGDPENERADQLANQGANQATKG